MTITIEDLMRVSDYEISITPCSIYEKGRDKTAMCFTVREFEGGEDLSGGPKLIVCAVTETLEQALHSAEKQMAEEGLIPLPNYTTPQERVRPKSASEEG